MGPQQINPTGIHSNSIQNQRDVIGFAGMRFKKKFIRAFIHAQTTAGITTRKEVPSNRVPSVIFRES